MDWLKWLEIVGVIVGVIYLWLEYKANIWLWVAGIIMPAIYLFIYYETGFYADFGINVYYLIISLYGWMSWMGKSRKQRRVKGDDGEAAAGQSEENALLISRTPRRKYLPLALICLGCFVLIAFILVKFTDSTVPYGDSLTTSLSIVAMWMLAKKYVEQWIVWVAVDIISCGLYIYKGLYPTGVLYGLYGVIAVFGYFKWLGMMREGK